MKKGLEAALGWAVSGVFVFGTYAIAHYMLKADDSTILVFAGCLLWSDIANFVNRDDKKPA